MSQRKFVLAAAAASICCGAAAFGADDASFSRDLKATIALQGMSCDEIDDVKRNGDSDYLVACKDGNRYHVFVDATGRVIVQKL